MKNKRNVSAEITAQQYYSGPLPPPDALIRYNEAVPSAAERIIQMAEKEMEHRQDMERKMMKSRIRTAYISIVFAFVAILVLAAVVVYAIHLGMISTAIALSLGAIASVAGIFVYRKTVEKRDNMR